MGRCMAFIWLSQMVVCGGSVVGSYYANQLCCAHRYFKTKKYKLKWPSHIIQLTQLMFVIGLRYIPGCWVRPNPIFMFTFVVQWHVQDKVKKEHGKEELQALKVNNPARSFTWCHLEYTISTNEKHTYSTRQFSESISPDQFGAVVYI